MSGFITVIETEEQYNSKLKEESRLVVIFGANFCKNCGKLKESIGRELSANASQIPIVSVNIDELPELADVYQVSALPHCTFITNGDVQKQYIGSDTQKFFEHFNEFVNANLNSSIVSSAPSDAVVDGLEPPVPSIHEIETLADYVHVSKSLSISDYSKVEMNVLSVLSEMGLDSFRVSASDVRSFVADLDKLAAEKADSEVAAGLNSEQLSSLYVYRVPLLSIDGTCSVTHKLSVRPFNLAVDAYHLFSRTEDYNAEALVAAGATRRLLYLQHLVRLLNDIVQADWIGIYRLVEADNQPALLKEAYLGEPSRAVFPVTSSFAQKSTNSWVGLTGNIRIIENINAKDSSISYYECSNKVQSELCVPIFGPPSATTAHFPVVGIIDLESWKVNHFDPVKVLQVIRTCFEIGRTNFGLSLYV